MRTVAIIFLLFTATVGFWTAADIAGGWHLGWGDVPVAMRIVSSIANGLLGLSCFFLAFWADTRWFDR